MNWYDCEWFDENSDRKTGLKTIIAKPVGYSTHRRKQWQVTTASGHTYHAFTKQDVLRAAQKGETP